MRSNKLRTGTWAVPVRPEIEFRLYCAYGRARQRQEKEDGAPEQKMPPSVGRRVSGVPVVVLTQLRSPDKDEESIPFSAAAVLPVVPFRI
jgi:hypothetical protein